MTMTDPLVRINAQLDAAAMRYVERRRRRRIGALGMATAVLVIGIASGASALTGVGPVADLLEGGRLPDLVRPAPEEPRVVVEQADAGGTVWTMRAYRAGKGSVFCIQAPPFPAAGGTTNASCAPYEVLARDLDDSAVFLTIVTPEDGLDTHLVIGLARADVTAVTVTTAAGRLAAATMSSVWTTAGEDQPLRAFLAVVEGPRPYTERPLRVRADSTGGEAVSSRWPAP
jgi:hypothetical protein